MRIAAAVLLLLAGRQEDRKTLTFVTYNILGDPVESKKRGPAILKLLRESDADVIALQEVVPWFVAMLSKEEWVKKYHVPKVAEKPLETGGQYLLSKFPIEKAVCPVLPGNQRRTVLLVTIKVGGRRLEIANTHMESPLDDGKARAKQLDFIFGKLKDADDAVFLGDLNFGDKERPETSHLDPNFLDLWRVLRPNDPGFTWNMEENEMARKGSFPREASRRLDRILLRSPIWKAKEVKIIGDTPLGEGKKELFPSDHFGVLGVISRE